MYLSQVREIRKDRDEWITYWLDKICPPEIVKLAKSKKNKEKVNKYLHDNGICIYESPYYKTTYLVHDKKIIAKFVIQINPPPELMCNL